KFHFQLGYKLPWYYKSFKKNYFKQLLHAKVNFFYFYALKTSVKKIKTKVSINNNITSLNLISRIESRPDIVLWRSGFCSSQAIAHFLINNKRISINNTKINLNSLKLNSGDLLKFNTFDSEHFKRFFTVLYNNKFIYLKERVNFINHYNLEVNFN